MNKFIIILLGLLFACNESNIITDNKRPVNIINTFEKAKEHKNEVIFMEGILQPFEVWTKGKGRGVQYWDLQFLFDDNVHIPAISINPSIELETFKNKRVLIEAKVFFGIVIGVDDGISQNATGWRIDINSIEKIKN